MKFCGRKWPQVCKIKGTRDKLKGRARRSGVDTRSVQSGSRSVRGRCSVDR
jgi:hypothetical protein